MKGGASGPPCWLAETGVYNEGEWEDGDFHLTIIQVLCHILVWQDSQ